MSDKQLELELVRLTARIERRNHLAHIFQYFFNFLIIGLLVTVVIYLIISQQQRTANVAKINANNTAQLDKINRHLDCLAAYFAQKDRASLTITDINKCTLQSTTGVQQFFTTPSSTSTANPTPTATPQASTPSSSSPQQTSSAGTSSNTNTANTKTPVTLLGLPLCVVGLCVAN